MPEQHEKAYQLDKSEEVFDVVFRVAQVSILRPGPDSFCSLFDLFKELLRFPGSWEAGGFETMLARVKMVL